MNYHKINVFTYYHVIILSLIVFSSFPSFGFTKQVLIEFKEQTPCDSPAVEGTFTIKVKEGSTEYIGQRARITLSDDDLCYIESIRHEMKDVEWSYDDYTVIIVHPKISVKLEAKQ